MNLNDLTITSLETITAFDLVTGDYKFTLDELQNATIGQTEDKEDITGKQGRKISTLKRNKALTVSGTNGLVSGGLLEVQTGGEFANKETEVGWTDYLTVNTNAAATTHKAIGTPGAEIEALFVKNEDGTLGKVLTQNAEVGEGQFTYDPETKALAFNVSEIADGSEIVVLYKRKIKADVLESMSDKYSTKCTMYVDAYAEDKCGKIFHVQFFIPKADFSGEFSLEMGDNQTVHEFEAEALAGACGGPKALWTYTIFGDDAADIA